MSENTEISAEIETLARMWMLCDPNRSGSDPDEVMGQATIASSSQSVTYRDTPLTGKPRWHWFIPRAEASLAFLKANGLSLVSLGAREA